MGEFIYQCQLWTALEYRINIHLKQLNTPVFHLLAGDDLKTFQKGLCLSSAMGFHNGHNNIRILFPQASRFEHSIGLTHARSVAEKNFQLAAPFLLFLGLDPDISVATANYQIKRVARYRGLSEEQVSALVSQFTEGRQFGILGESRVNVLKLNLALDAVK